ncbi:hypothetical protein [Nonomuraea sp. NPDC046570]|uniref:hypothetical protein n=1 Tax=Nonomuraea sp. NPDC046570 TaxID=3155255 RepID=UPI0033D064D5
MRSFEFVFGPKRDKWLVRTVAGLLVGVGWSQLRVAPTGEGVVYARRIGVAAAATLLTVELYYVPRGVIRPTYLVDSVLEAAWIRAWVRYTRLLD